MRNEDKTKAQISELVELSRQISESRASETGRKVAEEELMASEANYRVIFDSANDGIFVHDKETGDILDVNPKMCEMYGYTPEEARHLNVEAISLGEPPYTQKEALLLIKKAAKGEPQLFEWLAKDKAGRPFWVEVNLKHAVIRGKDRLLAIVRDITDRKLSEKKLNAARQKLLDIVDFLPDATFVIDSEKKVIAWNQAIEEITGISIESVRDITKHKRLEEELRKHRHYLEALVEERTAELKTANKQLQREIAERKQAEEELRLSRDRFHKIFNASPSLLSIRSVKDDRYIDVNESWLNHMGYRREEVIDRTPEELNFDVDPLVGTKRRKRLRGGAIRNEDFRYRKKSGEERLGLISTNIIDIAGEKGILAEIRDITELVRLKNEMARLERLNLIGEMAAGIGHEVRNPMTTVRGFLQMLGSKEDCARYKDYYNLMIEELDRANSIITEFLSLAKNKPVNLEVQNLNSIVKALSPLITADATNSDIGVIVELGDIPDLLLNEKEIRQLILNLVRNGLEAMSPGGYLTIRTFTDGKEVVLAAKDQGRGIEADLLEKIGTPFFTTKDYGTGLGLAVCYSIAARHNATIKVETSSEGTTFYARFKPSRN